MLMAPAAAVAASSSRRVGIDRDFGDMTLSSPFDLQEWTRIDWPTSLQQ
jgi:hypothetical protein